MHCANWIIYLTKRAKVKVVYYSTTGNNFNDEFNRVSFEELLNNSDILNLWENLSNGKNESFDLKCIYLDNKVVNEVPFIKAFKNTNSIIDKKFKRTFTLYRKFGNSQIFRTNLYTISNGKIIFDTSRYVYYLLENNVIYYLGIDLNEKDLTTYLFKK